MITHDLTLAPDADRILVIDNGRLTETGTHRELLARRGTYAHLAAPLPEVIAAPPPAPENTMLLRR